MTVDPTTQDPAPTTPAADDGESRLARALRRERDERAAIEGEARQLRAAQQTAADELVKVRDQLAALEGDSKELRDQLFGERVAGVVALGGAHPVAVADIARAMKEQFEIDARGRAIRKSDGEPADLLKWLEGQRADAPHWFPATGSGSGAPQNSYSPSARGSTLTRAQYERMNPAQRAVAVRSGMTISDH